MQISIDDDDQSITCLENLSNEIFYDIFDYLDGCHIYQGFIRLNRRFHQLLNSPSLRLKLQLGPQARAYYWSTYELLMDYNRHQIFSIDLLTPLDEEVAITTACSLDSSFTHLQSLAIGSMEVDLFFSLLLNLSSLPRLSSLSITVLHNFPVFHEVYQIVFDLPKLKFAKISAKEYGDQTVALSLPMSSVESSSRIEHLVIDHWCSSQNLSAILSYTPHLTRLKVMDTLNLEEYFPIISSKIISNLTDLRLDLFPTSFDRFERFLSPTFSKLKVLRLLCDDKEYLDARRWEKIIFKHLPQLQTFYLKFFHFLLYEDDSQPIEYPGRADDFSSSFWIERKWILKAAVDDEMIFYVIDTYEYAWNNNAITH